MKMDIGSSLLPNTQIWGDIIPLKVSNERHHNGLSTPAVPESTAQNFATVFEQALNKVNDQQVHSEQLAQQMVSEPGSVQAHTVMIAAEKARISLTFTKSLADLAVRTYRELSNLR